MERRTDGIAVLQQRSALQAMRPRCENRPTFGKVINEKYRWSFYMTHGVQSCRTEEVKHQTKY